MTLAQLRCLLAVVDAGSNITLAASRVNATQSAMSKQLKQLEEQLALKLFVRRGRHLERLTPAGEEIVERVRIIVGEADNIRALAANRHKSTGGSLHIETTHIQAQFVLPPVLARLRARFPQVNISLGFGADFAAVGQRNVDVDMSIFSTDGRVPGGGLAIPLYQWDPVAIVPRHHTLAAARATPSLAELAAYPLLSYDTSHTAALGIARTFVEEGLSPRFAYTVRDGAVIKAAVREGLGVGLLAEMALDPTADSDLHAIALAGLLPRCTTWAVLRQDRVMRDYTLVLLNLLSGLSVSTIQRLAQEGSVSLNKAPVPMWSEVNQKIAGAKTRNVAA